MTYFILSKIILLFLFAVTVVTSAAENVDCGGAGWSYYPLTGFCYGANVELRRSNWQIAEDYCKANGGHIATISNLEEYRQILSYVYTAWDGLYGNWFGYYTDKGTNFDQKNWISVDHNTPVDFEKYAPWCNEYRWGQQSPRVAGRRCLAIGWDQEKICFYDNDCSVGGRYGDLKAICKRPPKSGGILPSAIVSAPPEKYDCGTDGWSYYPPTGYCYGANIAQFRQTGIGAEAYCKQNGGHLATIESLAEYQHILSYVFLGWDFVYGNWLGYTTEGGSTSDQTKWTSVDGTHVNLSKFVRWCTTEFPRGGGKRCLSIGFRDICLYDVACNANTHKVICKRPLKAAAAPKDDKGSVPIILDDKKDEDIPPVIIDNKTTKSSTSGRRLSCQI